jgi:anti-anti-sigma regulatory factor
VFRPGRRLTAPARGGYKRGTMVVDLSETRYLDSAGVNVLFELAEDLTERQLAFALVVPEGGLVERVVMLVDLASVAQLHRSVAAAREAIDS